MQICMGRFSATTPALYNTNRGRGNTRKEDERSSRSLRSCVGKGPSLEIYWATVLSLSRISSTSVHLNYLRDCTVSEVIEWTDVDGWSVGWSVGWAVGWSVGRSVGRLDGRSVGRLVGWSGGWSVGRSVGRLVFLSNCYTHASIQA